MAKHGIPGFNRWGLLPPGEHIATFAQLRASHLIHGPADERPWNSARRLALLSVLGERLEQIWGVGYIPYVVIAGSFVEDTPSPKDLDAYLVCPTDKCRNVAGQPQDLQRDLNALDARRLWNWQREWQDGIYKPRMWHELRIEFYYDAADVFLAYDLSGRGLGAREFFACTRSGRRKGVVKILRDSH